MSQSEDPKNAVPQHLRPTYDLLSNAFPGGVPEHFYLPPLYVLYEEMSNRTLSRSVSFVSDKEYSEVYNDIPLVGVYVQGREQPTNAFLKKVVEVKRVLNAHGYQRWKKNMWNYHSSVSLSVRAQKGDRARCVELCRFHDLFDRDEFVALMGDGAVAWTYGNDRHACEVEKGAVGRAGDAAVAW